MTNAHDVTEMIACSYVYVLVPRIGYMHCCWNVICASSVLVECVLLSHMVALQLNIIYEL